MFRDVAYRSRLCKQAGETYATMLQRVHVVGLCGACCEVLSIHSFAKNLMKQIKNDGNLNGLFLSLPWTASAAFVKLKKDSL